MLKYVDIIGNSQTHSYRNHSKIRQHPNKNMVSGKERDHIFIGSGYVMIMVEITSNPLMKSPPSQKKQIHHQPPTSTKSQSAPNIGIIQCLGNLPGQKNRFSFLGSPSAPHKHIIFRYLGAHERADPSLSNVMFLVV